MTLIKSRPLYHMVCDHCGKETGKDHSKTRILNHVANAGWRATDTIPNETHGCPECLEKLAAERRAAKALLESEEA